LVNSTFIIFGASSEIGIEFNRKCVEKNYETFLISRNKIQDTHNSKSIIVEDYLDDFELINKKIDKYTNKIIIFFNGALYENRPKKFPNETEIKLTEIANYIIPYELCKRLHSNNNNIVKFVFISSIAAVKLRYKNFIYGESKRKLENDVKTLKPNLFLIFRFGKVFTNMSEGHKTPPFSMTAEQAASIIIRKINRKNIVYPNFGLFFIAQILKFTPRKIIDILKI